MGESVTVQPGGPHPSVLIVQPDLLGHRATYVRHLVAFASTTSGVTLATTSAALHTSEYKEQLVTRGPTPVIVELEDFSVDAIAALAAELGADHVVAPDGDALAMALARGAKWTGPRLTLLIMRPDAQPRPNALSQAAAGWAKKRIFSRVNGMANVRAIRLVAPYASKSQGAVDPVDLAPTDRTREQWRAHFALDETKHWAAVVGAVTPRKCPDAMLEALAASTPGWGLFLAGPCDPEVLASVDRLGLRTSIHDRYLADEELDGAVIAADVVVAAHLNEGPSGIVAKAMALGTPTLAAGARSLKDAADCAPGLVVWSPLTMEGIVTGLNQLSSMGHVPVESIRRATPASFAETLLVWPT